MPGRKADKFFTFALALALIVGACLLAYPSVSEWWNSSHQTRAVASYEAAVDASDEAELSEVLRQASEYNARLAEEGNEWILSEEHRAEYENQLVVEGSSVMGYVKIPKISCTLPIYHGTDEAVLQVAVGHIEGSSLPVGGLSTHSVISGHRGLTSARLFTDLDQLEEGDIFTLHVLGESLSYQVDQILVVEPADVEALEVVPGEDYCTLVTCTPYGVNSHRLLVRGCRVDDLAETMLVAADAVAIDSNIVAACIAAPVLVVLFVVSMVRQPRKKRGV